MAVTPRELEAAALSTAAWQRSLLPLMSSLLVLVALYFGWLSVSEFSDLKKTTSAGGPDISSVFTQFEKGSGADGPASKLEYFHWKTMVLLEQQTIRHRYAQVSATIMARLWTRLLGFTTGMILAIVGAAFILGKLQEERTELSQESQLMKVSLATSSPGVVLAVLGSVLMAITLLTKFDIDVRDVPVYLTHQPPLSSAPTRPAGIPDPSTLLLPEKSGPAKDRSTNPSEGGTP